MFNEVQLCLTCPEAADKVSQACVHMMERFKPNMALLTGLCTASKHDMKLCTIDGCTVRLGDVIVSQTAVKISSGADVKEERYRAQTKQVSSRLISDLRFESRKWERDGGLWLQRYKSDIPLRPMRYQRLWYTRLYMELELTSVSEILPVCLSVRASVCVCAHEFVCEYVLICVVCVSLCTVVYTCMYTHTWIQTCGYLNLPTCICVRSCHGYCCLYRKSVLDG